MENDYKELFYKDYQEDWDDTSCDTCGSWFSETLSIADEEGGIYVGYEDRGCYHYTDEYEELEEFFKLDNVPEYVKNDVKDFLENN